MKQTSSKKVNLQGSEEKVEGEKDSEKTKSESASSPEMIEEPVEEKKVKGENDPDNSKHGPSFIAEAEVHTEEEQVDAKKVVELSKHKS